jgi:DNA repair protein RadA/Sms
MAKISTRFICQSCGYETPRWLGKCPECSAFNSFSEEKVAKVSSGSRAAAPRGISSSRDSSTSSFLSNKPQSLSAVGAVRRERMRTGMPEFDRVLGGGVVPGSLVLIGGDPGIGKSTLLIEASVRLAAEHGSGLYLSGEESTEQIRLRADRLNLASEQLMLGSETDLMAIENHIRTIKPAFAVIDSIQTTAHPSLDAAPGTLTQVREAASTLQRIAKEDGVPIFIVGHVNKEGNLAGPRALEHIVDTVLQLEGDEHGQFRILRAAKNRFGSTNELGVFEMTERGMESVENPSQLFLAERQSNSPGSVVVATVEGARPLLVEVQALCSPSYFTSPRRTVTGADFNRVLVVLAVVEKRLGLRLGDMDVYVNVVGGLRVTEPALDLGIAMAIISSLRDVPVQNDACVFGEIGLAGEVRAVAHADRRASEATRLGLKSCVMPRLGAQRLAHLKDEVDLHPVSTLREAVQVLLPQALTAKASRTPRDNRRNGSGRKNDESRDELDDDMDQSTLGRTNTSSVARSGAPFNAANGEHDADYGPFGDE